MGGGRGGEESAKKRKMARREEEKEREKSMLEKEKDLVEESIRRRKGKKTSIGNHLVRAWSKGTNVHNAFMDDIKDDLADQKLGEMLDVDKFWNHGKGSSVDSLQKEEESGLL